MLQRKLIEDVHTKNFCMILHLSDNWYLLSDAVVFSSFFGALQLNLDIVLFVWFMLDFT